MSLSASRLCLLAKMCDFAYTDDVTARTAQYKTLGYNVISNLSVNAAQAQVIENATERIIVFRGTHGAWNAPGDFVTDLTVVTTKADSPGVGWAHRGFVGQVRDIWTGISAAVSGLPSGKRLVLTGHSLGAGMAAVATNRLAGKVVELSTFGQPLSTGDAAFNAGIKCTWARVVNANDIVTQSAPVPLTNYVHGGELNYLTDAGKLLINPTAAVVDADRKAGDAAAKLRGDKFCGLTDHSIGMVTTGRGGYAMKLSKL